MSGTRRGRVSGVLVRKIHPWGHAFAQAAALQRRAFRPGVTHARRAAGMAWNAVLTAHPDERSGRSYMEHVVALAADATEPDEIRAAAQRLRDTPPAPPELVTLGKPDLGPAHDARAILNHAHRLLTPN